MVGVIVKMVGVDVVGGLTGAWDGEQLTDAIKNRVTMENVAILRVRLLSLIFILSLKVTLHP